MLDMTEIRASSEGFEADGQASGPSVERNHAAIQTAIYKLNAKNENGRGGRVIIDDSGWAAVKGDFDLPTGITILGEGPGATNLNVGDGCNSTAMFRPHTWKPGVDTGGPNAWQWRIEGLSIHMRQHAQGAKVTDARLRAGFKTIWSPTYKWTVGERVVGSGIPPDTVIAVVTAGYVATMSNAAVQTLDPATVYCGVDHPMYGIYAATYPRVTRDPDSGDRAFDPKGAIRDVEIAGTRDGGVFTYGRSGLRMDSVTVIGTLGVAFTLTFDVRAWGLISDYAAWGGLLLQGSSCQIGQSKFFNSGQTLTTLGAQRNMGYGVRIPGYYSLITLDGVDCQQNTGHSFDLSGPNIGQPTTLISLNGVTSSAPGYLATRASGTGHTGAVGFNLDNATRCVISGTHAADAGTPAIRMPANSTGHDIRLGCGGNGPVFTSDTVTFGNSVTINGAKQ